MITVRVVKDVKSRFLYDPETGAITRKIKTKRRAAGSRADFVGYLGYRHVKIDGNWYPAHRVAWVLMTGEWPKSEVDHKDLDRSNNKWSNLREANHSQNQANGSLYKNNLLGFKGVSIVPNRAYPWYRARIRKNGKEIHLGCFNTPETAHVAYVEAAKELHGDFWRAK